MGCLSVCCRSPTVYWQRMWGKRVQGYDLCLPLPPHWMRLWDKASLNLAILLWTGLGNGFEPSLEHSPAVAADVRLQ